jgi:putative SOS response-associated peptidase YedK
LLPLSRYHHANKLVATIDHEGMLVILTREDEFDAWLNGLTPVPPAKKKPRRSGV